jgi:hypothetical protein
VIDVQATARGLGWAHVRKEPTMPPTTVFVVEDAKPLRELLRELLGLDGDAVLTAASVPEAEAIRQGMGLAGLDLVMTDLRLTRIPQAWERYKDVSATFAPLCVTTLQPRLHLRSTRRRLFLA